MLANTYLQKSANLFKENRLLKVGFVALLGMNIANWHEVHNIVDAEKTVLMPVGAAGNLWVTNTAASDDYVMFMTRYVMHQVGDYKAPTARQQFNELVRFFSTDTMGEAKTRFDVMASEIEKYPSSASEVIFSDRDVWHDAVAHIIKLKAEKIRYLNGVETGKDAKSYVIEYKISHGRFVISRLLEESA